MQWASDDAFQNRLSWSVFGFAGASAGALAGSARY
jgi:hypothetical protein